MKHGSIAMSQKKRPSNQFGNILQHSHRKHAKLEVSHECCSEFFLIKSVVHHGFTPVGQRVNNEYYLQVLWWLHDATCHKRPEKWSPGNWQIHKDNAPVHLSQLVQNFLAKHKIPQIQ